MERLRLNSNYLKVLLQWIIENFIINTNKKYKERGDGDNNAIIQVGECSLPVYEV